MESRLELAIVRQTEELTKAFRDQGKFYLVVSLCVQGAFGLGLLMLLKLH